jgi:glyoxylase-like metal-dependent hydrolase (beta-lactamase superfamily II)
MEEVGERVFRIVEPHYREDYRCSIYLLRGRDRDVVLDTGLGLGSLKAFLEPVSPDPLLISSHSHYDHIGSSFEFAERLMHPAEAEIAAHPTPANTYAALLLATEDFSSLPWEGFEARDWVIEPAPATGVLEDGDRVDLGDRQFEVLNTPGHSWGSICLWEARSGTLFSADTVYDGELFDFLPCSDVPTYVQSLRRLRKYPVRMAYPGHGKVLDGEGFRTVIDAYLAHHPIQLTDGDPSR